MQKKLTITMDKGVYEGLQRVIGKRKISQFIEGLVRPHVMPHLLDAAYRDMASNKAREAQALDWSEAFVGELNDESR
jgi:predicted CopG family antitoxin